MKHANYNQTNLFDLTQVLANPNEKFKVSFEFMPQQSLVGNNPYKFVGAGQFSGYFWLDDQLHLQGTVIVPTQFVCSRCGAKFEQNLFVEVNEVLTDNNADDEHFSYTGNKIDLDDLVAQIIASNIPSQALCKEDCLGVCQYCGVNLNEQKCNCDKKLRGNNPFASLMDKFN